MPPERSGWRIEIRHRNCSNRDRWQRCQTSGGRWSASECYPQMTAVQKHLGITMLLLSYATAQTSAPVMVQKVSTTREGTNLRVEIVLSSPVKPTVETAANPSRILLDLPDTACNSDAKNVPVHMNGVRQVRTAQHSTTPFITRVVLDLDRVHPYVVTTEGNKIILKVETSEKP